MNQDSRDEPSETPGQAVPSQEAGPEAAQLRSVVDELAAARHSATVGQGTITATVDGNGQLLDIEIDPYLDASKRSRLSSLLLDVITEARRTAAARGTELLDAQLGGADALRDRLASAAPWLPAGSHEEERNG